MSYKNINQKALAFTALTLGVSSVVAPTVSNAQVAFKDIKATDHYYEGVNYLSSLGIIKGYQDQTFKPFETITRQHAAKILAEALQLDLNQVSKNTFSDIAASNPYAKHITALYNAKIISGYADGTFKPEAKVTRAQLAKMLVNAYKLELKESNHPFKDVNKNGEFNAYIGTLFANNITTGKTDNTYGPNEFVTRGQFASFVYRAESIIQERQVKVIDIKDGKLVTDEGTYKITSEVAQLFSLENLAVLKNAIVNLKIEKNGILGIQSLQINASATEDSLILDAANVEIAGLLTLNSPNVTVKNTKAQSIQITDEAYGNISLENIEVANNIDVQKATGTDVLASLTVPAAKENLKLNTTLTTVHGSLVVNRNDVAINISENSTFEKVMLDASGLELNIAGKVEELEIKSEDAKVQLENTAFVNNIKAANISSVIKDFDLVKDKIGAVNGDKPSVVTPTTPVSPSNPVEKKPFQLSILHVNDTHGNVENAPKRVTIVKNARQANPNVVVVDAGDVFSGTLYFNKFKGQADVEFMNLMKVDVMTLGNHEFDLGSSEEGHQALYDFIKAANFPIVSSNVDFSKDDLLKGLFNAKITTEDAGSNIYAGMVKVVNGEKVGFFGLTTAETEAISSPVNVKFQDYIEQAQKMVDEFKAMGVNKIVAVSHVGYDDNAAMDNDIELAKNVDGIDVIVGGHTHTELKKPVVVNEGSEPTVIVQAYQYGDYVGELNVTFDDNGVVTNHDGKLIPTKDQVEDKEALKILEPYKAEIEKISKEEIGVVLPIDYTNPRSSDKDLTSVRSNETILGDIITDGMLKKAKEYNKDVTMAFQNGGGIRKHISKGSVTVGQVIDVLPFGNTLATMTLTGAEIKEAFEVSFKSYPNENGGFLHVSGVNVKFDVTQPVGKRVVSIQEKQQDGSFVDLEDEKNYTIATNAFTAKGGDGFDVFAKAYAEGRVTDLGLSDWENFKEQIESIKDKLPTAIEGRIVEVTEATKVSVADARSLPKGNMTVVEGTVVGKLNTTIQIDDGTGAISIYGASSWNVEIGDKIVVKGKTDEYQNLKQLSSPTLVKKVKATPIKPLAVKGTEIGEDVESKLVEVKNVEVIEGSGQNFTVVADGQKFVLRDELKSFGLEIGDKFSSITGIVQQFKADYQLIPMSKAALTYDPTVLRAVEASHNGGFIVGSVDVTLTTTTENAKIYYTLDGTTPTADSTEYTGPITIGKTSTLKTVAIANGKASEVKTFAYEVTDKLRIHDIQGAGHTSKLADQMVENVEGIVTYIYDLKGSQYMYIQTPDDEVDGDSRTSEGILLYAGKNGYKVEVGDKVAVTGTVSEYLIDGYAGDLLTTQINVRDDKGGKVTVLSKNNELPAAFVIDETTLNHTVIDNDSFKVFDPEEDVIDFWESLESMRVEVSNVKATGPQDYGDLVTVLESYKTETTNGGVLFTPQNANPQRIQFRLEPNAGAARSFDVKTGDKFVGKIDGIVAHSYTNYKIQVDLDVMKSLYVEGSAVPEKTELKGTDTALTIASYNLENYSANDADGETPNDKAEKTANAIVEGLGTPDIIGVTEVQDGDGSMDSGSSSAEASYARLIQDIKDKSGVEYKYVNIDPENNKDGGAPGANIRVGFLYKADRVKLVDGIAGEADQATKYVNGQLTYNPGRIDPNNEAFNSSRKPLAAQFEFNGEKVVVIANHWNSKSGDTGLFGDTQPVTLKSAEQRLKIANIVAGFVKDITTTDPAANVVALGDFNDFQFTPALQTLEQAGMYNMIYKLPESDRYTYVYQGQSQALDHILVTSNLSKKTDIDILHVNADYTEGLGRASDHDPVLISIDFSAKPQSSNTIDVE